MLGNDIQEQSWSYLFQAQNISDKFFSVHNIRFWVCKIYGESSNSLETIQKIII